MRWRKIGQNRKIWGPTAERMTGKRKWTLERLDGLEEKYELSLFSDGYVSRSLVTPG